MWSCGFQSRHPVELVFHLPSSGANSMESHGLSKICVWNYNRGIKVSWWQDLYNVMLVKSAPEPRRLLGCSFSQFP